MAMSNKNKIQACLDELRDGLTPFVQRNLIASWGENWLKNLDQAGNYPTRKDNDGNVHWDAQLLLLTLFHNWNTIFQNFLGHAERSYVSELRNIRNEFAHQKSFSVEDTLRTLDTAQRLLTAVSAQVQAKKIGVMHTELMRTLFQEKKHHKTTTLKTKANNKLKSWRDVVTPHTDVASGNYEQAEFAADLAQVHRGEGVEEYLDPIEFYRRTYLTHGLDHLLTGALRRISGKSGDPVVELQTNFGGGKTHSMLALFHLFGGTPAIELAGIETILKNAGISKVPIVKRAVLVGTALSPGQTNTKDDGTEIHTLWGEMAWQLGGKDGYSLIADSDLNGTSPGSMLLAELLNSFGPALVLIDEWIAFIRQLYGSGKLPAGSFDANLTFAQSLTEAAKATKSSLVVASLPASDIEIGGEGGREALARLKNTFGRVESTWKAATDREGFEIVRRRLFQPITDQECIAERDEVVNAFSNLYRSNAGEFPADKGERDYAEHMRAAYPIHPELFRRLYDDWGSLDKFQRTRGVLRLMAAVIHSLWDDGESSLLIMPGNIPIDNRVVRNELTRYMSEQWDSVISKDVDGEESTAAILDKEISNLGRISASRRVARTIYMGSAPISEENNPGITDPAIRLGCVQPGEQASIFGDALRRLAERATFLNVDGSRYWLSTKQSIVRLAKDRASQHNIEDVWAILPRHLKKDVGRGKFSGVHITPDTSADIPDEMEARLVILGPEKKHVRGDSDSDARRAIDEIITQRGLNQRVYRNMLVFLAPDANSLSHLEVAVRQFMAWESILNDREILDLPQSQINQAKTQLIRAEETIKARISETWIWCLAPAQSDPKSKIEWSETRLQGQDELASRVSKKLCIDESLMIELGPARLKMVLDKYLWTSTDHLNTKKLWEYLCSYLYLPRLKNSAVLKETIQSGTTEMLRDKFAYADYYDETTNLYTGLVLGERKPITIDSMSVVVKQEVAKRLIETSSGTSTDAVNTDQPSDGYPGGLPGVLTDDPPPLDGYPGKGGHTKLANQPLPKKFFGSVKINADRLGRDAGRIAEEVLQHLSTLPQAQVKISLEIDVEVPEGASDEVQDVVTKNCEVMKFDTHGFDD